MLHIKQSDIINRIGHCIIHSQALVYQPTRNLLCTGVYSTVNNLTEMRKNPATPNVDRRDNRSNIPISDKNILLNILYWCLSGALQNTRHGVTLSLSCKTSKNDRWSCNRVRSTRAVLSIIAENKVRLF